MAPFLLCTFIIAVYTSWISLVLPCADREGREEGARLKGEHLLREYRLERAMEILVTVCELLISRLVRQRKSTRKATHVTNCTHKFPTCIRRQSKTCAWLHVQVTKLREDTSKALALYKYLEHVRQSLASAALTDRRAKPLAISWRGVTP